MIALARANRHGLRAPRGGCTVAGKVYKGGQFCLPYRADDPHGLGLVDNLPASPSAPAPPAPDSPPVPTRLAIHGFVYLVESVPIHPEVGSVAFRMDKLDTGHSYFVRRSVDGRIICDCADLEFRRAGSPDLCKHGAALRDAGLVIGPAPAILPPRSARPVHGQVVHQGQAHRVVVELVPGRPPAYLVEMARPGGDWLAGLAFEVLADAIHAARHADDDPDLNPRRSRRPEPSAEEIVLARQLFGELADDRAAWVREYAASL